MFLKKILVIIIIILFLGLNFTSSIAINSFNRPISKGITFYVGGTGEGNYSSIQDAIDGAYYGDTVYVFDDSSPYYENIVIDKSLKLIGENKETTIIDGSNNGDAVFICAAYVNISGFTIRNSSLGKPHYLFGIKINSNYTTVTDNILSNNYYGIALRHSHDSIITNNKISSIRSGISLVYSKLNTIKYNNIKDCKYGIFLSYISKNNLIEKNIIYTNENGIYVISSYNIICNNYISNNNNTGIIAYTTNSSITENFIANNNNGIDLISDRSSCSDNIISGNNISNNNNAGISIENDFVYLVMSNIITNNLISKNLVGISASYSFINIFKRNNISENQIGIKFNSEMLQGCIWSNKFIENNLINNEKDVFYPPWQFIYQNKWRRNYWNEPNIFPKLIFFGMVYFPFLRIPFFIPHINIDWRPALKPYNININI